MINRSVQNALQAVAKCNLSYTTVDLSKFLREHGNNPEVFIQREVKKYSGIIIMNEEEASFLIHSLRTEINHLLANKKPSKPEPPEIISDYINEHSPDDTIIDQGDDTQISF